MNYYKESCVALLTKTIVKIQKGKNVFTKSFVALLFLAMQAFCHKKDIVTLLQTFIPNFCFPFKISISCLRETARLAPFSSPFFIYFLDYLKAYASRFKIVDREKPESK